MSSAAAIVNVLLGEDEVSPEEIARASGVIVSPDDFVYERQPNVETEWEPVSHDEVFYDTVRYLGVRDADGNPRVIGHITVTHDPDTHEPVWEVDTVGETGHRIWSDVTGPYPSRYAVSLALLKTWKDNERGKSPGPYSWESNHWEP